MKIDISKYTVEELFQSFESIDDIQYPERALEILKLLIDKSGLSDKQIPTSFQSGTFLNIIGTLPVFSSIASDTVNTNNEVTYKLNRLIPKL